MIKKVVVANRGEIAVRIIRSCREIGLRTVAVFSEADRVARHVTLADEAVFIGPAPASRSYLNIAAVIGAAIVTKADALHPGYGFLAENPRLAEECERASIRFIGPSPEVIRAMGDKVAARQLAQRLGIPVVPGSGGDLTDPARFAALAAEIGYPLLVKAAAGGGGRGMSLVVGPNELLPALTRSSSEARTAFGNDAVYLEKYVTNARHVEVQILGDGRGEVIQLGERDCSVQRRHQKLIEESPCLIISDATRRDLLDAALTLARHVRYGSAGTVEFLVDLDTSRHYFIEMNTRIQVEHPVTEMLTAIDLVREQFALASGTSLRHQQEVRMHGHVIECRINAEDSSRAFLPAPGRLEQFIPPSGPAVRVDTHCFSGHVVPPFYDSLLAKVIVSAPSRPEALARMCAALAAFQITGIPTTIPFHLQVLNDPAFCNNQFNTRWAEDHILKTTDHTVRGEAA